MATKPAHFLNLSNGLACAVHVPPDHGLIRIQSTWCEQKRWEDVASDIDYGFLFALASGRAVIVHDRSERPRMTRACWQGLAWIHYICQRTWRPESPAIAIVRNNVNETGYFSRQYAALDRRTLKKYAYFRKYYSGGAIKAYVCNGRNIHWTPVNGREVDGRTQIQEQSNSVKSRGRV